MKEISSIWTRVMEIAHTIAQHSNGRIVMVFGEHDSLECDSTENAHFLKLDGARIGRDIQEYGILADEYGWQQTLTLFLDEIVVPLEKLGFIKNCKTAVQDLNVLAHEIYPVEQHYNWDKFSKNMI